MGHKPNKPSPSPLLISLKAQPVKNGRNAPNPWAPVGHVPSTCFLHLLFLPAAEKEKLSGRQKTKRENKNKGGGAFPDGTLRKLRDWCGL